MFTLKTKIRIDAAHFLPNYEGKCKNLHGHTWLVEVICKSETLDVNGFVVDFSYIKKIVNNLDHHLMNDFIELPTAEFIAHYLYKEIPKCVEVTVWETPDNSITYAESE